MLFILLLGLGALSLASVSAYFSVWGLAHTFPAVFWGVIFMGVVIEYGKLIGISFMYRYWNKVSLTLKRSLYPPFIIIILIVMAITAGGHYGYLSSGYQTDVLPLKQIAEQIKSLEEEKTRKIDRKLEIDKQITQLPSDFVRNRIKLIKQFQDEQLEVTKRVNEIDVQLLTLKTESLKAETRVGPVIYLAKAFNIDTDRATNYLILMIICVFDPLALLLTIATNVAIRQRELDSNQITSIETNEPLFIEPTRADGTTAADIPAEPSVMELEQPLKSDEIPEPKYNEPSSIVMLRNQLSDLNNKNSLSDSEQMTKNRIEEQLRYYEAQNFISSRESSLNR